MKFSQLVELDSTLKIIKGNPEAFEVVGISHSHDPQKHKFIFIKNRKFLDSIGKKSELDSFNESGVIVEEAFATKLSSEDLEQLEGRFAWVATIKDVNRGMCFFSKPFYDELHKDINVQVDGRQLNLCDIDPSAEISQGVFIGSNVTIGKNVKILPGCVILPNVTIGEGTILYPNITVYSFVNIGKNCRIHSGTVIGADGFGYNFIDGEHKKIWHLCGVEIGNNVEIGASTMIDCGAFTPTRIGDGSKLDNDVQVAHNVFIGKHVIMCGKAGLAGSAEAHDFCALGGLAGVAPGGVIEKGVQVAAQGIVAENAVIKSGEVVAGHPARPLKEWLKGQAVLRKLIKN